MPAVHLTLYALYRFLRVQPELRLAKAFGQLAENKRENKRRVSIRSFIKPLTGLSSEETWAEARSSRSVTDRHTRSIAIIRLEWHRQVGAPLGLRPPCVPTFRHSHD
jgi:hypothetical protein